MASWFIRPETVSLPLSDGQSITVRKRLSAGEQRARFARMYAAGVNGDLQLNHLQVGMATITAYLTDWSLVDDGGDKVPIRGVSLDELQSVLDALDPSRFREIRDAVDAHESAMTAERADEQKKTDGATALLRT
jgi:hypothetical protein